MTNHTGDQKRIAKNTVMLYIRMIVIMIVSLYTTRVVLNVLGETDYGIYNIVGSVVVSMVFIRNSSMSATQRFLSYEIGLKERGNVSNVFSASMVLHLKFIVLIVLLLETIGLWFLNNVLDIPDERVLAANIVYQLSIITFCFNLARIPYNAVIISFENMNVYAVLSIVEALLKLALVFVLKYLTADKLILYGVLVLLITFIVNSLYIRYCRRNYADDVRITLRGNKDVEKKLRGFLGWNLLGGVAGVATMEGPNYFMNYYLGVTANAAMGIAKQVSGALFQFSASFQSAFNPQIVKAYASGENDYLMNLIIKTSLLSFYLLFIISLPVVLCANFIFNLWLIEVPHYTIGFSILIIISQFVVALASPLWMVVHATGDIKRYQIVLSCLNLLIIPASFIILKFSYSPYYILIFQLLLNIAIFIYRLYYTRLKIGLSLRIYFKSVVLKALFLSLCIIPIPFLLSIWVDGILGNVAVILFTIIYTGFVIFFLGIDKKMRREFVCFVQNKIRMIG